MCVCVCVLNYIYIFVVNEYVLFLIEILFANTFQKAF